MADKASDNFVVDQAIASQKEATSKVIESVKVNFKFKGNKLQY